MAVNSDDFNINTNNNNNNHVVMWQSIRVLYLLGRLQIKFNKNQSKSKVGFSKVTFFKSQWIWLITRAMLI